MQPPLKHRDGLTPAMGRAFGPWFFLFFLFSALLSNSSAAQESPSPVDTSGFTVHIEPQAATVAVGERLRFAAKLRGLGSREAAPSDTNWFSGPFDAAVIDSLGEAAFYVPGAVQVGAAVGGKVGFATVTVSPAAVARVDVTPIAGPVVVGGVVELVATPRTAAGEPRSDVPVIWTSDRPEIATVSGVGVLSAVAPGRATLHARAADVTGTLAADVIENPVHSLSVEPASATVRTGDVVKFKVLASDGDGNPVQKPFLRWTAAGEGSRMYADGAFVADYPGTYLVTVVSGDRLATAAVNARPREVGRTLEVVGRGPTRDLQAGELWVVGRHAYLSSIADRVWVYDVSDPSHPVKTDSLVVDARLVNDVSTTADGRIGVLTREGASNRRNGIVFFDASDPARPKIVSEYTETVTGGVHSAFIDGHHVYLTDDATGSLRVIEFADVKSPREVARWEVESAYAGGRTPAGQRETGGTLPSRPARQGWPSVPRLLEGRARDPGRGQWDA